MRGCYLRLLGIVGVAFLWSALIAAQNNPGPVAPGQAAEEKEACTRNLKVIYDAIQAYQFDHKDLPNWLSDLVPGYLSDGNVLICPVCRRTGRTELPPLADPKLACSYVFEFSPVPVGSSRPGESRHTRREWKRRQMGLIGSSVPLVRCRHHDPVLNLGFNGTIFESPAQWELLFTNRIRPAELSTSAIFGGQEVPEENPAPLVAPTGTPTPSKRPSSQAHTVDLASFYTSSLTQAWQDSPGDNLAALPRGYQTFGGVEFKVDGILQLGGKSPALTKYPAQVKGITVNHRCQHLYFLHAATLDGNPADGEQIGSYLVHLPDSEMTLEIPIYYGRSVCDWHQKPSAPEEDRDLKVVWTGQNDATKQTGKSVRLFLTSWNLAPGVDIGSLDFISTQKGAAPFLVAISYD